MGLEEYHLFLLLKSMMLSVTDYRLGLSNTADNPTPLKHGSMQTEVSTVTPRAAKDTSVESIRVILALLMVQTRRKEERIRAYLSTAKYPHNPPYKAAKDSQDSRLRRRKVLEGQSRRASATSTPTDRTRAKARNEKSTQGSSDTVTVSSCLAAWEDTVRHCWQDDISDVLLLIAVIIQHHPPRFSRLPAFLSHVIF